MQRSDDVVQPGNEKGDMKVKIAGEEQFEDLSFPQDQESTNDTSLDAKEVELVDITMDSDVINLIKCVFLQL